MFTNVVLSILHEDVVVDTSMLRSSSVFNDLLNYGAQVIHFPNRYSCVANVYLSYINGNSIVVDTTSIKTCFELCHYLDDSNLLLLLVNELLNNFSQYKDFISQINTNIQTDICYHLPYCYSTITDDNFFTSWCKLNVDKVIKIQDTFYLSTIKFYVECGKIKRQYTPHISQDGTNYQKHGVVKIWSEIIHNNNGYGCDNGNETWFEDKKCEELEDNKLFLEQEINYDHDKKCGSNYQWYQNGKLKYSCVYLHDMLHGTTVYQDERREYTHITPYKEGQVHGIIKRTGIDKINNYEKHVVNDVIDEYNDSWYPITSIQKRQFMKTNNRYQGEYKVFFEDGIPP